MNIACSKWKLLVVMGELIVVSSIRLERVRNVTVTIPLLSQEIYEKIILLLF